MEKMIIIKGEFIVEGLGQQLNNARQPLKYLALKIGYPPPPIQVEEMTSHPIKKKTSDVFIERAALCTVEGIKAICGTDEEYKKYVNKLEKNKENARG